MATRIYPKRPLRDVVSAAAFGVCTWLGMFSAIAASHAESWLLVASLGIIGGTSLNAAARAARDTFQRFPPINLDDL